MTFSRFDLSQLTRDFTMASLMTMGLAREKRNMAGRLTFCEGWMMGLPGG
jgi:hypothetical protein